MSEPNAAESTAPEVPAGVTLVTNENFEEYVDAQLGVQPAQEPEAEVVAAADTPEAKAAEELKQVEAQKEANKPQPKQGDIDGTMAFHDGKWVKKHDFNYRLWLKGEEVTKAKEADIQAATDKAKKADEAREAAERRANELAAKYEPPDTSELGPEPDPAKYEDINAFKKDLKEWTAKATRREDAAKAAERQATEARQNAAKAWGERIAATKAELPDYEAKITASDVKVSDQMREAIFESDVGPKLLYHLAENPDVAEALGKMTVGRMLRELGKIEAKVGGAEKPSAKSVDVKPQTPLAEISRAPAPITPLRGANTPAGLKIDADGNWTGTVDEFRAAHRAGKV